MSRKRIIHVISLVTLINLSSKLVGILKESAIAAALGIGVAADLFVFSVRILRALYELFADGLAMQAMLPVLSGYHEKNASSRSELEASFSAYFSFWIVLLWVGCTLLSPLITIGLGLGWFMDWFRGHDSNQSFFKAIILLCQGLPFFATMTAAASLGVGLHLRKKFFSTAFLPALVNIVSLIFVYTHPADAIDLPNWLILGLSVAGFLALALQLFNVSQTNLCYWPPKWNGQLPGIKKFRKLAYPIILSGSISQIASLFSLFLGSFLKQGSLSLLYFAQKISEVLLSALGVGICTALMPQLSKAYQRERLLKKSGSLEADKMSSEFYSVLLTGINLTLLTAIPAMIFLSTLRETVLTLFYGTSAINALKEGGAATLFLGFQIYILGACGANFCRILSAACFARHDAHSHLYAGICTDVLFFVIGASALLWGPLMICIGQTVSTFVKLGFLFFSLKTQHSSPNFMKSFLLFFRMLPAFFLSYLSLWGLKKLFIFEHQTILMQCGTLLGLAGIFAALSLGFLMLFGLRKMPFLLSINQ